MGIVLLLWAYGMQVHGVIGAWREARMSPEAAAHEHLQDMAQHAGMDMPPPAAPLPLWRIVTSATLLACGVVLALVPIWRGEAWAVWMTAVVWLGIAVPRIATDPRCWVAYDPHQHGCHTFMGALAIGVVGLGMCAVAQRQSLVVSR